MKIKRFEKLAAPVLSIIIALLIGTAIIKICGYHPLSAYSALLKGAFGSFRYTMATLEKSVPLILCGIAAMVAMKSGIFNIGAEGQILLGGIAAAACMMYFDSLPNGLLLVVMFLAAAAAGGFWAFIPGISKAKLNTNETLFTLMMNYIAIQLTSFFVTFWENSYGSNIVGTINLESHKGWFPDVFGQMYGLNVIIVAVLAVTMYFYLKSTKHGFEIAVVGESHDTARYAAINVPAVTVRTVTLSGAVCGIAGFLAVAGQGHTISTNTAGGRGYVAIIVAWLAKFNTLVMILVSFLIVFLEMGAREIASKFNISDNLSQVSTGIILFFILGSEFFINYKVALREKDGAKQSAE